MRFGFLGLASASCWPCSRHGSRGSAPSQGGLSATASIPLHTLYQHALDYAALEQYFDEPIAARSLVADIDRVTPSSPPADEAILMAAARRQYSLLGTHFPELPGAVSLLSAPQISLRQPGFGHPTVFFLFPPWCAQCIRQAQEMVEALVRTAMLRGPGNQVIVWALLADHASAPNEAGKPSAKLLPGSAGPTSASGKQTVKHESEAAGKPAPPKSAVEQLWKTPTLVVAPGTIAEFNASDFPFLIATDDKGIIRLMVPGASDNALAQDGPVDQITKSIAERWAGGQGSPGR